MNATLEEQLQERDEILNILKGHLGVAQNPMKKFADRKRRKLQLSEGDAVFVKLRPYRQKSFAKCKGEKLAPNFFGPYTVEKKIGTVAYKLNLPPKTTILIMFSISPSFAQLSNFST